MYVLLDTNILLDIYLKREPLCSESLALLTQLHTRARTCITVAQTKDVYYFVYRTFKSHEIARGRIKNLQSSINILSNTPEDSVLAIDSPMTDYEDALIAFCAERHKVDYIVTRNVADFKHSPVPAVSPAELMAELERLQE